MHTTALFTGAYYMGRLADQGLANTFGLTTLRHGTNPLSWLSIHIIGTLPLMGNSKIGGDYGNGYAYQNVGRTYFVRSPDFNSVKNFQNYSTYLFSKVITCRVLPKTYTASSTANLCINIKIPQAASFAIGGLVTCFLPTIKFRFSPEEVSKMQNDKSYQGFACSTDQKVSPLSIGVIGTAWNTMTYKTPIRMFQNPVSVITGVAQLALVGVVAYHTTIVIPSFVVAHKTAIVAGLVLGMI